VEIEAEVAFLVILTLVLAAPLVTVGPVVGSSYENMISHPLMNASSATPSSSTSLNRYNLQVPLAKSFLKRVNRKDFY
jgi:hypothetical protein